MLKLYCSFFSVYKVLCLSMRKILFSYQEKVFINAEYIPFLSEKNIYQCETHSFPGRKIKLSVRKNSDLAETIFLSARSFLIDDKKRPSRFFAGEFMFSDNHRDFNRINPEGFNYLATRSSGCSLFQRSTRSSLVLPIFSRCWISPL